MSALEELLGEVRLDRRAHERRLGRHVLAQLACLGTHTITGLLGVCGEQFRDWSAHYRLYERDRVDPQRLFDVVRARVCALCPADVVAALDDTRVKKTGRKVHGASYARDPLSPPFHTNLVRAQRFVQTAVALPGEDGEARMIPADWVHAPVPPKPDPKADEDAQARYRELQKQARLGRVGVQCLARLRDWMDRHGAFERRLWAVVDGSLTNGTVLKALPARTTLVGRIRSDARLYHLPDEQPAHGRRRVYGRRAPTPDELRRDDTQPWQRIRVRLGGERRELRVKRLGPVRWRCAGKGHTLQLVVVAPTPYRLSPHGPLFYRQPAYLICTDPEASLEQVVQHYLWRWDIEVNLRDEKTVLGVGEAQVRTPAACQNVTACAVGAYALLLLAAERCRAQGLPVQHLPAPKWQRRPSRRATTPGLLQNVRYELWARAIHSCDFAQAHTHTTKPQKWAPPLDSALFYASRHS